MKSFLIINFYLKLFTILLQQQQKKKKTFHFDKLAYRRIDLNIVSAWLFVESLNSEQIAVIPSGGAPTVRSFTIANSEPAIAPRLPSQCSGFESNLRGFYISLFKVRDFQFFIWKFSHFSNISNAFADIQNSPVRYDSLAINWSSAYDSVLLSCDT